MNLRELRDAFYNLNDDTILEYGLKDVFSWRGSYDEVAFSIGQSVSVKQCKELIWQAYHDVFWGYKGGEYHYGDYTPVNFEGGGSSYSDGGYTEEIISQIESTEVNYDRDQYLINLMVTK